MTVARSALFAGAIATAAFGCRHKRNPEPALDTESTNAERSLERLPPLLSAGFGTSAPNGGGALGGAVVSSAQGRRAIVRTRSRSHFDVINRNHELDENHADRPADARRWRR